MHKAVIDSYRDIFLEPILGSIILDSPVGFKISGEFGGSPFL